VRESACERAKEFVRAKEFRGGWTPRSAFLFTYCSDLLDGTYYPRARSSMPGWRNLGIAVSGATIGLQPARVGEFYPISENSILFHLL